MNQLRYLRACLLLFSLVVSLQPIPALSQSNSAAKASQQQTLAQRDGQHDFDFEIGAWKTHLKRLLRPLTGSTTWVEYDGTTVVRKVWNGPVHVSAHVAELKPGARQDPFERP